MDLTLDDILFSVGDDQSYAVPFDDAEEEMARLEGLRSSGGMEGVATTPDHPSSSSKNQGSRDGRDGAHSKASTPSEDPNNGLSPGLLSMDPSQPTWLAEEQDPQDQPYQKTQSTTDIDQYFLQNGASRPPVPCSHCRRLRLQCLIIQTTDVNPNPLAACSSCVALFRECSLSGSKKRSPSIFETAQPVIGHLHGVNEDEGLSTPVEGSNTPGKSVSVSALAEKRTNTRSVRKTRVLRNWFASHLDHPYPTEEEKTILAAESGLNKTQVINWFANTRRRNRMPNAQWSHKNQIYPQGSPMPQSYMANLSPMERWRNSPPDQEPASPAAIQTALASHPSSHGSMDEYDFGAIDGGASSTSGDSFLYNTSIFQDGSSNSASSCYSNLSSGVPNIFSPPANSSTGEGTSASWLKITPAKSKGYMFQCTFCNQSFRKKYDWIRHERSVHLPGLDSWVCSAPVSPNQSFLVWQVNATNPQCIFCGEDSPTAEHTRSHEFDACVDRPVSERTFNRKDHLWQHLYKFHGCRKWSGWKPDLSLLQHRQDNVRSRCGFCQITMTNWDERTKHVAAHFKSGLTMADWTGGNGIDDLMNHKT